MKSKKLWIVLIAVFLVILMAFVVLFLSVKPRAKGTWEREIVYLDGYGCDSILLVQLKGDGTVQNVLCNADTGAILKTEKGRWSVSFFEIKTQYENSSGTVSYKFNPFNGTMENNNHKYTKIN